jgi:hypothetical protein
MKFDSFGKEFLVVMGAGIVAAVLMLVVLGGVIFGLIYSVKILFF